MEMRFRTRHGVARLRPLLALTALAAAILMLCAVAENAGAPAPAGGCDSGYTGLQAGGWGEDRAGGRPYVRRMSRPSGMRVPTR